MKVNGEETEKYLKPLNEALARVWDVEGDNNN